MGAHVAEPYAGPTMQLVRTDGGRAEAGYRGAASDCVCRAIAIATGTPYQIVYDALNELAKAERPTVRKRRSHARTGVHRGTYEALLKAYGWSWKATMGIGTGTTVHMREDELPGGTIIVRLSKHVAAVVNGILYDTHDCTRGGNRAVYGYFYKEA